MSFMMTPQFTRRTPDRALNRVLATVRVTRLGFSGFKMGIINSSILLSLGFLHYPGWRPSLGSTAPVKFPANNPSFLPAHPSFIPALNSYTSHQVSGVQFSWSFRGFHPTGFLSKSRTPLRCLSTRHSRVEQVVCHNPWPGDLPSVPGTPCHPSISTEG